MTTRFRKNFLYGLTASGISSSDTTITSSGFYGITVPSGTYLPIILAPGYLGSVLNPEIVYVNSITSSGSVGIASVTRAQETTSGITSATSVPWVSGLLASDFTVQSGMVNGDFPTPSASGQLLMSTASGASFPYWTNNLTLTSPVENFTTHASTIGNSVSINADSTSVHLFTGATTVTGFTINVTASTGSLINYLQTNQSITTVVATAVNNGYCGTVTVDGGVATVYWGGGGAAPTYGSSSGYDTYTITVTKDSTSTVRVFAAWTAY